MTQVPADKYPEGIDPQQFDVFWLVPKGAGRYDVKFILGGATTVDLAGIVTDMVNPNVHGYSLSDQVGQRQEFLLNKAEEALDTVEK